MTERQQYYLGIILSYAVGILIAPIFFIVIGVCRLALTVCGIVYDTFMFTPRVVNSFIYRHYEKELESEKDSAHLN